MKYCKCGCGNFTKWSKQKNKYNDYCLNHQKRGTKHSKNTKNKISISTFLRFKNKTNHPMYGKPRPEATKNKISKTRILKDYSGSKNPFYGKKHTEETRKKIKSSHKKNKNLAGSKNPAWLGGKSFEKYGLDWTDTLKESIRQRDNYCCKLCNKKQIGQIKFDVHHIDYNKQNHNPENLITLCKSCHR